MGEMEGDGEALERLLPAPAPVAMQGSPARPPLPSFGWSHMEKAPPLEGGKSVRQRLNEFVQEPAQEGLQKDGLLLRYLKSLPQEDGMFSQHLKAELAYLYFQGSVKRN